VSDWFAGFTLSTSISSAQALRQAQYRPRECDRNDDSLMNAVMFHRIGIRRSDIGVK